MNFLISSSLGRPRENFPTSDNRKENTNLVMSSIEKNTTASSLWDESGLIGIGEVGANANSWAKDFCFVSGGGCASVDDWRAAIGKARRARETLEESPADAVSPQLHVENNITFLKVALKFCQRIFFLLYFTWRRDFLDFLYSYFSLCPTLLLPLSQSLVLPSKECWNTAHNYSEIRCWKVIAWYLF